MAWWGKNIVHVPLCCTPINDTIQFGVGSYLPVLSKSLELSNLEAGWVTGENVRQAQRLKLTPNAVGEKLLQNEKLQRLGMVLASCKIHFCLTGPSGLTDGIE